MGRETGREKLEFENLLAKRGYFGQKPGGFRALGPGHTVPFPVIGVIVSSDF